MNVQQISRSACLTAVLATVFKRAREMDILNVFTKITLVIAFLPTDRALKRFDATLTSNNVVIK